jgi:hypothetical protein
MASLMQIDYNIPRDLYRYVLKKAYAQNMKKVQLEARRFQEEQQRNLQQQKENKIYQAKLLEEEKARIAKMEWDKYNRSLLIERKRELEEELNVLEKEVRRREKKSIDS